MNMRAYIANISFHKVSSPLPIYPILHLVKHRQIIIKEISQIESSDAVTGIHHERTLEPFIMQPPAALILPRLAPRVPCQLSLQDNGK